MKIKISYIIVLLLGVMAMAFNSCEEKDDYNYDNIEPKIFAIVGDNVVAASGLTEFPTTYTVAHRGGSTYAWTIGGHGGTYVVDSELPNRVYVTFNQSSDTTAATITVVETTQGGKSSEPFTKNIVLTPFCPYDMSEFEGNWTGTSTDHDAVLVAEATGNLNEIRMSGLAGFVNFDWGENWTAGDGSCVMVFKCGGVVEIPNQWIGDTDYPDIYRIEGGGTYDEVAGTITLDYEVFYDNGGSSAGSISTVLTKQ